MNIDKAKISLPIIFAAVFFLLNVGVSKAQDPLERVYEIHADFSNIQQRTFPIDMVASITNHSKNPVEELQWVLYPNRFLRELPYLNDLNYRRIYPNGFSKGYLDIKSLKVDEHEVSKNLQSILVVPLPENTLYSLKLEQAIQPGETKKFHFVMELKVPEKFGSFGYYRDRLTLSGGWTPYVVSYRNGSFVPTDQSPQSSWKVQIKTNANMVVGSELLETKEVITHDFQKEHIGQFPIQIGEDVKVQTFEKNNFQLHIFYDEKKPEKIIDPLRVVFDPWSSYVSELGIDNGLVRNHLSFIQAPLREMLAVDAGDVSFFSDRSYKLVRGLHSFHNVPLIRMLFAQLVSGQVAQKENAEDYQWITEAIASQLTEDFLQTQHYKYRDARNIGAVKFFSIFPLIDLIIHTPQFAFFDVFYDFVYPYDPVRDEFVRFQHRKQYGRSVLAHMIDEIGEDGTRQIISDYIREPSAPFARIIEKHTQKNMDQRVAYWRDQRPVVNYEIERTKSKKTSDGYEHQITVEKESIRTIEEPVEIEITEKNGKKQSVIWFSPEKSHTYDMRTESKLKSVEIDPKRRLLEAKLEDNRRPPYWKFVLTEFFAEYDFNAKQPVVIAQSQLRKKYGGLDRYNFGGYYQADSYGVNFGYVRLFGQILDSLRLSNGAGISFNVSRLNQDDVLVDAPTPTIVAVTNSGFLTSVTTSYFFGNQISYTNPLSGGYGGVSFTYGTKALGGDFNYYETALNGSWIFKLHPSHLLAFRGYFGISGPDSMPSQVQFRLGGITTMRGLGIDDEQYIGRNILLVSGEYRHFLVQDLDWNLGFFRVRDIQGALFGDAGRVTNTIQEKADRAVLGGSVAKTTFSDLFDIENFETDVGYGIHFFVDYLGVSTSLLRFDVARSLSDQSQGYRFYFGVTQSF